MATPQAGDALPYGNTDGLYRTLSATRGVLLGMGVDIEEVMVSHVSGPPQLNKKGFTTDSAQVPTRRKSKIISIVQALCDKLYMQGYILDAIDFRETQVREVEHTEWSMRVLIKNKPPNAAPN